ncbi:MAG TPA: hypothetical protein VFV33_05530 [Gemmatimonadaceae bacterium]|nr:hypothetical protein [Gemmatimonadaceae bacterium]
MDYSFKQWQQDTKGSFGRTAGRSKELQAVDQKFQSYEAAKDSVVRKADLKAALAAWKATFGPGDAWKTSARNANRAIEQLDAMLAGTDEETAFNKGRAPDWMHESLVHSRMGVLYLFSNLSIQPGLFSLVIEGGLDLAGQGVGVAVEQAKAAKPGASTTGLDRAATAISLGQKANSLLGLGDKANKVEEKIFKQPRTVVSAQQVLNAPPPTTTFPKTILELRAALYKIFQNLVEKIKDKLRDKFGIIQDLGGYIPKVINFIVNRVCVEAAPLAGSIISLVQKTGALCLAVQDKFQAWLDGKHVQVNDGHPATVVDSIRRAQTGALLGGIYEMITAAAGVAIDATAWGGGVIFNLVKSGIELLIKFVWRLAEALRFNEFCAQAREYYVAAKGLIGPTRPGDSVSASADSLPTRPFEFARWYRSFALNIPLIAVLTLNSGICGDKMSYLTMFNDNGQITSDQFLAGVRFLDNLKPWGAEYMENTGYTIQTNGDVLVDNLCNTFAKGQLSELARKGTVDDNTLGGAAQASASMSGNKGPAPLRMTSMGFGNSRDVGKSQIRMGAERLFKGIVKG